MFWLEVREFSRHRQPRWGWIMIILVLIVFFAIMVMVLVSTGDFGHGSSTPVPSTTPGSCQPFCTAITPAPGNGQ
jgi:hypothetical protein